MTKLLETMQLLSTSIQVNIQEATGGRHRHAGRQARGPGAVDPDPANAPEYPTTCRFCITIDKSTLTSSKTYSDITSLFSASSLAQDPGSKGPGNPAAGGATLAAA